MRPYALLTAAAAFMALFTEAYIHTLGLPLMIQLGVPFDVYYKQLIGQPRVHNLIFGIIKDNGLSEQERDWLSDSFVTDILSGGAFIGTLSSKFTIPADFEKGPAIVKVLITEFSGLFNGASFRTILVPVTVGETTSTQRSFGGIDDENAVSWVVSDSA